MCYISTDCFVTNKYSISLSRRHQSKKFFKWKIDVNAHGPVSVSEYGKEWSSPRDNSTNNPLIHSGKQSAAGCIKKLQDPRKII